MVCSSQRQVPPRLEEDRFADLRPPMLHPQHACTYRCVCGHQTSNDCHVCASCPNALCTAHMNYERTHGSMAVATRQPYPHPEETSVYSREEGIDGPEKARLSGRNDFLVCLDTSLLGGAV